ncbi:MAG: helix-turn-helix domain-containing protein [bacterium]|nr:helix-turn-helix domain-containing protein [bacterium]
MKSEINIKLGKRIRFLRLQQGISQEKLAEAINIATTSFSYIETGRGFMTLGTLEKFAQTLGVELYEIFKFSSLRSNREIYNHVIEKINNIKENDEKLGIVYNFVENVL